MSSNDPMRERAETHGSMTSARFTAWMGALEQRHLSDLRIQEVTRALRALSSSYVQRRERLVSGAPLDSAGKRAAFAVFYGPLHYLTVDCVLAAMNARPAPRTIWDLGCGTGAAGAAWAVFRRHGPVSVRGVDRHPWAVAEARWTYRQFEIDGHARSGDVTRIRRIEPHTGALAAYVLNELDPGARNRVLQTLLHACGAGAPVLVLEPIAARVVPWWEEAVELFVRAGGHAAMWRFPVELPSLVRLLDRSAGLDHRELTVRTLACNLV